MKIFVNFSKKFVNWKVLKGQQENEWLSSKLLWGDNCNIVNDNVSNWHRNETTISKFSIFQSFYASSVKFSKDFVNWKNLKGQQGKGWLISSLFRRVNCIFLNENVSNWHRKSQNSHFQWFYVFFPKFLADFVNWIVPNGQQGKHVLSSMLRKDKCRYANESCPELTSKKTISIIFRFALLFVQFLSRYW